MFKPVSEIVKNYALLQNKGYAKKLSQNFIFDTNILKKIVDFAGDLSCSHVLEIGPGPGGLTQVIAFKKPLSLTIIEKDPRCVEALESFLPKEIDIQCIDFLEFDLDRFFKTCHIELASEKKQTVKILGNLPYNISSEILKKLVPYRDHIDQMVFMFQKEFAERLCANPGSKDYGRLSILAQAFFTVEMLADFKASVFIPRPTVDSKLVSFKPKKILLQEEELSKITQILFSKRRKQLRSILSNYPSLQENLHKMGCDLSKRPENLSVETIVALVSSNQ